MPRPALLTGHVACFSIGVRGRNNSIIQNLKFGLPQAKKWSGSIPSGSAVTHGGNPQDRAASPKSKIQNLKSID